MPQVLAVCDECGRFFESGTGVDPGGTGVTLTVESTPRICPTCGGSGHVLGGAYHIAEDTIKLLQGPERTVSELERLREILREAQQSNASVGEVRSTLWALPGLGPALADLLVPTTPADFYALVTVVLVVVEMILAAKRDGRTPKVEVNQVINNITVQAPPAPGQPHVAASAGPAAPRVTTAAQGRKIGRNKPCPCDSGLKFKKCCGADGRTRYSGP